MNYPRNPAIKRAEQEGYEYTGCVSRGSWDKDKVEARMAEFKVMGNKVKILLKKDVTEFRDSRDVHSYWVLYVKYSEEYKADQKAKQEANEMARRKNALRRMADECTLEELAYMITYKTTHVTHEAEVSNVPN